MTQRLTIRGALVVGIFALFSGSVAPPVQGAFNAEQTDSAHLLLNSFRQRAAVGSFLRNTTLDTAARNHALYLETNGRTGHGESPSLPGFTGATPADRTTFAGYPTTHVLENISSGSDDALSSLDSLFSAIYHRFGFLNTTVDETGVGAVDNGTFVYNIGNTAFAELCATPQPGGTGRFRLICADDKRIREDEYQSARVSAQSRSPAVILWPPPAGSDIPPFFAEESPDPLPDRSISGYPVSVQLNELYYGPAQLLEFRLFRTDDGTEITNTRIFDAARDPNAQFSDREFALFPLDRLTYNTRYRVRARLRVDGAEVQREWEFVTRDLGLTVLTATDGTTLSVGAGSSFAVYVPPKPGAETVTSFSTSFMGASPQIAFLDPNTLRIDAGGAPGGSITVTTNAGGFTVRLTGDPPLRETAVADCVTNTATFDWVSGLLALPRVDAGALGQYSALLALDLAGAQAGFRLFDVAPGAPRNCPSATFEAQGGTLTIPSVTVFDDTTALRAAITLRFDPVSGRFILTHVDVSP